jgi:HTH-type transcriptional regulator, competence development regulator
MESSFGSIIRKLREEQNLYLRQVASQLEMDTGLLSKIEKGVRQIKREQVGTLATILNTDKDELLTVWLADQIFQIIKNEPLGMKAIKLITDNSKL